MAGSGFGRLVATTIHRRGAHEDGVFRVLITTTVHDGAGRGGILRIVHRPFADATLFAWAAGYWLVSEQLFSSGPISF